MKQSALSEIIKIVGQKNTITATADKESYITEWRGRWRGHCDLVVTPRSTRQVSKILSVCHHAGIAVTPQSGNTGLVGGSVPFGGIVLSMEKMSKIINTDPINFTLTSEAGAKLKNIQIAANKADRLFPLSLASEGSCQIGGNLATNAGGVHVLKYGNARDLVLGLEVVLPNGTIWEGLRGLRKDNSGYDLKQIFLGSEGTLGVITRCVLKIFPKPREIVTAFAAISSPYKIIELYTKIGELAGESLSVFEFMNEVSVSMSASQLKTRYPFSQPFPYFVLLELTATNFDTQLRQMLETILSDAMLNGTILDAVLASSNQQRDEFWRIRDTIPEAQVLEGASIKNDISVPLSKVPDFLSKADYATTKIAPGIRHVSFGHIGDGNIHYNLSQPIKSDANIFIGQRDELINVVNEIVNDLGGSFSAEHGIGTLKIEELNLYRSKEEVNLMKLLKNTLDPKGIMNPGKMF